MDLNDFKDTLAEEMPPAGLPLALQALWHEAKGDWETAHALAQRDDGRAGAWVHAYLHRKEGDASNASYWYGRAAQPMSRRPFEEEWEEIATALLADRAR